jgi:hypothetical protein
MDENAKSYEAQLKAVLCLSNPYPTVDVIKSLCEAVEHLLHDHGCDQHGYEIWDHCLNLAKERIETMNVAHKFLTESRSEHLCDRLDATFKNVKFDDFCIHLSDGFMAHDIELMIAYLCSEEVLFANTREYNGEKTVILSVNCNDIFCPAADAEEITLNELPDLCRMYIEEENPIMKWVAKKRGIEPKRWQQASVS